MGRFGKGIAGLAALAAAGCASSPTVAPLPEAASCIARYEALDRRVDEADARDGGAHRVAGFPYLRSSRFLASFRGEVGDDARFDAWVRRLRALDLDARASELRNLGEANPDAVLGELDRCGSEWAKRDLARPERRAALREAVIVPDDYSMTRRVFGVYPVVVPFLKMGINNFDEGVREDYARPVEQLDSAGPLRLWRAETKPAVDAEEAARWLAGTDPLGVPELSDAQWQKLAESHAPAWWIETGGAFDAPGAPKRNGEPSVTPDRAVTYFLPAFTRYHGKVLAQLVYVVWFAERPRSGHFDAYGGPLDGVVWRVTLDTDGRPLLYDTVHACGCYHYYYAAKFLRRHGGESFWEEPILFPQQPVPQGEFAVRLQSGTHFVRRLAPLPLPGTPEPKTYALADYREVLSLPSASGPPRSLFDDEGIARGTERLERMWLWPAGIESSGAMRQWGRHATSFVGRSHFDDPDMLDKLFE